MNLSNLITVNTCFQNANFMSFVQERRNMTIMDL